MTMILRDWGANVAHAQGSDGLSGLSAKQLSELSFIITDYNLGNGVDGITLALGLRAQAPSARVLVLSGSFHAPASQAAASAGFEFLRKPARAELILAWLERS
ncbi:MAG: response regulator [Hyphomonadaceae bacterium]|nr:response regulator [Hyphomonadaceae bacterium]